MIDISPHYEFRLPEIQVIHQAVRQMIRPNESECPDHLQEPLFVILRQKRRVSRRFTERHVENIARHEVRRLDPSWFAEAIQVHNAVIDEMRHAEFAL